MRYSHFKLFEDEVQQLKKEIIPRIQNSSDEAVLNKVASLLRKTGVGRAVNRYFSVDEDAKRFINRLSQIIIDFEVPIPTKVQFLREFGSKNMIKPNNLFDDSGQPRAMEDWFEGSDMAKTMFKKMINDPGLIGKNAGEAGPGELAIACFHRDITAGTNPSNGYDLKWGSEEVEVKASTSKGSSSGGRWTAMNDYPLTTYAQSGESVLDPKKLPKSVSVTIPRGGKTKGIAEILNDPQFYKDPSKVLNPAQQREIYGKILKLAYSNADDAVIQKAANAYPNITLASVAPAAFDSYREKQQFTSMLLIRASGDTVTSIHFKALATGIESFMLKGIYMSGQQRGMSMQATLR